MNLVEHGTRSTYVNHRCRCERCKAAEAAYCRLRYRRDPGVAERVRARQRQQTLAIQAIKLVRGCSDCGCRDDPANLDFDHRPGTLKLFNVSEACQGRGWAAIEAEIEKCDVRCKSCHRKRHHREGSNDGD